MDKKDYIYIYNIYQANYLLKNNCPIDETGYAKNKNVYWRFIRNETTIDALNRWRESKLK